MKKEIIYTQYGCFACGEIWKHKPKTKCFLCYNRNIISFTKLLNTLLELDIDHDLPMQLQKLLGRE